MKNKLIALALISVFFVMLVTPPASASEVTFSNEDGSFQVNISGVIIVDVPNQSLIGAEIAGCITGQSLSINASYNGVDVTDDVQINITGPQFGFRTMPGEEYEGAVPVQITTPDNIVLEDYSLLYQQEWDAFISEWGEVPEKQMVINAFRKIEREGSFITLDLLVDRFSGSTSDIDYGGSMELAELSEMLMFCLLENLAAYMVDVSYENEEDNTISSVQYPLLVTTNPVVLNTFSLIDKRALLKVISPEIGNVYVMILNLFQIHCLSDQDYVIPIVSTDGITEVFKLFSIEGLDEETEEGLLSLLTVFNPNNEIGVGITNMLGGTTFADMTFSVNGESVEVDANGRIIPLSNGISTITWSWENLSGQFKVEVIDCYDASNVKFRYENESFPVMPISPPAKNTDELRNTDLYFNIEKIFEILTGTGVYNVAKE